MWTSLLGKWMIRLNKHPFSQWRILIFRFGLWYRRIFPRQVGDLYFQYKWLIKIAQVQYGKFNGGLSSTLHQDFIFVLFYKKTLHDNSNLKQTTSITSRFRFRQYV